MRNRALRLSAVLLAATLLGACNLVNSFQGSDDKTIIEGVQSKLFQDPVLKSRDIRVVSQKGVVVLTGTVSTDLEKAAAERMAGEVKGVKQVIDQIEVSGSTGTTSSAPEPVMNAANNPPPATRERTSQTARRSTPAPPAREPAVPPSSSAQRESAEAAPATTPPPVAATTPPEPEPVSVTIPAGQVISVRMIDTIDSSQNRPGEEFAASVASPVVVGERVIIREGSDARVRLIQSKSAGRMAGQSELQVQLIEVTINGMLYNVQTGTYEKVAASRSKRTAQTVGGGAALGALIGAIAGKGKGAAIGAGVGAAAGTGVQAATHGEQVKIPSETKIDFTLQSALTLTL